MLIDLVVSIKIWFLVSQFVQCSSQLLDIVQRGICLPISYIFSCFFWLIIHHCAILIKQYKKGDRKMYDRIYVALSHCLLSWLYVGTCFFVRCDVPLIHGNVVGKMFEMGWVLWIRHYKKKSDHLKGMSAWRSKLYIFAVCQLQFGNVQHKKNWWLVFTGVFVV